MNEFQHTGQNIFLRIVAVILSILFALNSAVCANEMDDILSRLRSMNVGKQVRDRKGDSVDLADLKGWNIVVAADASPSEQYAAGELQRLLNAAGAPKLDVVTKPDRKGRHIFVGSSKAMRQSPVGFKTKDFGAEDLRIVVAAPHIAIAGGHPRGTLYGVYTFAEDCLDIRFLTADHTHVPSIGAKKMIGPFDWTHRPVLEFRGSYSGNLSDPAFATRLRFNALFADREKLGGLTKYRLINHTFNKLLPTRRYGKEHPEWYALRNGERRWDVGGRDWAWDGTQLCCSNQQVIEMVTKKTLKRLKKHPEWKNISVSQNDNPLYCQCDKCAAIDKEEGSHMGSLLRLVNEIADTVKRKRPDVMVGTLAYLYSRKPPKKTRPRDNVQIQLCSFEACQFHALNDPECKANASFAEDLRGWAKICDNIYIWHYVVSFRNYLVPCTNYFHLGKDIRFLIAHNVKGIMAQGAWNARGGEFADLRNYVLGHMMWDPTQDPDVLMNEFVTLHYGKAAPHIRRFLEGARKCALASGNHPACPDTAREFAIDQDFIEFADECFQKALDAAQNDEVRSRIRRLSVIVPASRLALTLDPLFKKADDLNDVSGLVDEISSEKRRELIPVAKKLNRLMTKHNVTNVAEGIGRKNFQRIVGTLLGIELK